MNPVENSRDRLLELDAIRGLAALGVVIYHYTTDFNHLWGHEQGFRFSLPWGAYGVQVFFVLSGFVILMTLERAGSVREFAVNRAIRLYPAYWAAIVTTFAVVWFFGLPGKEVSATDAIVNFSMLQKAFGVPDVDGPYWTLYVELCFYFLMALIFGLGLQRWLVPIIVVVCLLGLLNTHWGWWHEWPGVWRVERAWPLRSFLPYFLFGILLYRSRIEGLKKYSIWLVLCFAMMVFQSDWPQAILAAAVMVPATQMQLPALRARPFVGLGVISYSLYLIHANVGYVIIKECYERGLPGYAGVGLALGAALVIASVSALLIEGVACRKIRQQWKAWSSRRKMDLAIQPTLEASGQSG